MGICVAFVGSLGIGPKKWATALGIRAKPIETQGNLTENGGFHGPNLEDAVGKQLSQTAREAMRVVSRVGQPCAREFLSSSAEGPKGP